ncbi:MAG TPA: hypothetical protein DHW85_14250 [Lachnospiraceae bacterium]|nr:hypothetical protein [Lachnospiraceae bacterium]
MSKKARRELDKARRSTWGALSPVTRKVESKKVYNRKKIREKDESFFPNLLFYRFYDVAKYPCP